MGPRIDAHLELVNNGRRVKVVGPTGDWDRYAVSATFKVVIGQIQGNSIVLAIGHSDRAYTPADTWWDADADVHGDAAIHFNLGAASAWAIASVEMRDGVYEPYPWSVETRLVVQNPAPLPYPPPWWP